MSGHKKGPNWPIATLTSNHPFGSRSLSFVIAPLRTGLQCGEARSPCRGGIVPNGGILQTSAQSGAGTRREWYPAWPLARLLSALCVQTVILANSANVTRSGSASRSRIGRWARRIRFSAIRVLGAFLLYSHAADSHVAASLQRELQTIAKPWYRCEASEYFGMRQIYPPLLGFGRP